MPWYLGSGRVDFWPVWSIPVFLFWSVVWTGLALWHSAKRGERWWFVFFLLVHTLGIVEFLYLAFVVRIFNAPASPGRNKRK